MQFIYLDQFVVRKCFCPDGNEPHREFFDHVGTLCMQLAEKRTASFPFSESHLRETSLVSDVRQREILIDRFQRLSNGYQFTSEAGIIFAQAIAIRNGNYPDWPPTIFESTLDFRQRLEQTFFFQRKALHEALRQVLLRWQSKPPSTLGCISKEETDSFVRLLIEDLTQIIRNPQMIETLWNTPHFQLFIELCSLAEEDGVADPATDALEFIRNRVHEIPSINLAGKLWASFAKSRHADLHKTEKPANWAEDIHFFSCFVPHCDAAFIDNGMRHLAEQAKLPDDFKTRLFSQKSGNQFLEYLSNLRNDLLT